MLNYALVFLALLALMNVYFWFADKFDIIDRPNERSSHRKVTIRGGGIIFPLAFFLYLLFADPIPIYLSVGIGLIGLISFLDDLLTLPNRLRIAVHFLCLGLVLYELDLHQFSILWIVPVLIVGVGIVNAYNFMDGINGIHGLYSLAVLLGVYLANRSVGCIDAQMLYFMFLAIAVFGFYNFRKKAKCFAGDVGSVSVALLVVYCVLSLILATGDISYLLFLLVYGLDSVFTIIRRLSRGENIFQAHRSHLYQYLSNELAIPQLGVSISYALLQFSICLLVIGNQQYWQIRALVFFVAVALPASLAYLLVKRSVLRAVEQKSRVSGRHA